MDRQCLYVKFRCRVLCPGWIVDREGPVVEESFLWIH